MTAQRPTSVFLLHGKTFAATLRNLASFLMRLPEDKAWEITVKPYTGRRSDRQNRYLWGVVYATLEKATGQDADDWHEYWLGECFGWETVEMFGRKKLKPLRRSKKLSPGEFAEYVEFIQRKAAEKGVYIPDPDPMLTEAA